MANWVRALEPASALLVLLGGLWRGSPLLGLIGLAPLFMPLALYRITRESLEAFVMRLSLLPDQALTQLDAAVSALYRMAVSRRRLLEWTTADDSERRSGRISPVCGGVAAIAALLSVFHQPAMILFAVVLAGLWGTAAARSAEWEKPRFAPVIYESGDADALRDLAARTWRFFAENTPENGLVPDNVQLDPPRGAAERTSPTNIGLYMVSCAAARLMGLIDGAECARRLEQTVSTLERLETWRGQFYNWYDVRTEKPMPPRYVSSVDSGNLAASLLLCASLSNAPLKSRLETLAKNTGFEGALRRGAQAVRDRRGYLERPGERVALRSAGFRIAAAEHNGDHAGAGSRRAFRAAGSRLRPRGRGRRADFVERHDV